MHDDDDDISIKNSGMKASRISNQKNVRKIGNLIGIKSNL